MFAIIVVVVLGLSFFVKVLPRSGTVAQFIIGAIQKGVRVGDATSFLASSPNEIAQDPDALAASANLDLDTYALARIISSEEGNSPQSFQLAIACASKNAADRVGASVFEWATDGSFGKQGTGRPCSTAQDPYQGHVVIAKAVMTGQTGDITNGAFQWVAPKTQDILHSRDPDKYKSFADVNASRIADGRHQVDVAGVDPALLVFYA